MSEQRGSRRGIPGADALTVVSVVALVYLLVLNYMVTTSVPRRLALAVGLAALLLQLLAFRSHLRELRLMLVVAFLVLLGFSIHGIVYGYIPVEAAYLPGNVAIGLAMCRGLIGKKTASIILYPIGLYLLYRLWTAGTIAARQQIFLAGSANGISEMMIALTVLWYTCAYDHRNPTERPAVLPALLCVAACVGAIGRSGIIASLGMFLVVLVLWVVRAPTVTRRFAALATIAVVASVGGILVWPRIQEAAVLFSRFQELGLESQRTAIWSEYLAKMGIRELLWGYDNWVEFAGFTNVHNSFLLWHKSLGIVAFALYGITAVALVRGVRRDPVLTLLFGFLLLRALFDESLLPSKNYDFLFFYFVATLLVGVRVPRERRAAARRPAWTAPHPSPAWTRS